MTTVYISSRFDGRTFEDVVREREFVTKLLRQHNLLYYDPAAHFKGLTGPVCWQDSGDTPAEAIAREKWQLQQSDVLLALTGDQPGWESAFEACLAYVNSIPIVVVQSSNRVTWLTEHAARVCPTIPEAVEWIAVTFTPPDGYVEEPGPLPTDQLNPFFLPSPMYDEAKRIRPTNYISAPGGITTPTTYA
jgi:hypothetical protein